MTPPRVRKWIRRTGKSACATGCRAEARRYILRRAAGPGGGCHYRVAALATLRECRFPGATSGLTGVYQAMDGRSSYP